MAPGNSSQPRLTALLPLGISKSSISSSIYLRLIYSSGWMAPGKTQVGADLGLHNLGNPKAKAPSGPPSLCPCTADPPQRAEVCGQWSQPISLQLTGLGKSLPLNSQQQPRVIYTRRVYSAHRKGTPQIPSLGDRGGCASGP